MFNQVDEFSSLTDRQRHRRTHRSHECRITPTLQGKEKCLVLNELTVNKSPLTQAEGLLGGRMSQMKAEKIVRSPPRH